MFQKLFRFFFTLFVSFSAHSALDPISKIECTAADVTDVNRFTLEASIVILSPELFQSYFEPQVTLAGPHQTEQSAGGKLVTGKWTLYPAGTLYFQDVWHLQGTYENGSDKISYSLLLDARNYTSSTITVNEFVYYAQCLRAL